MSDHAEPPDAGAGRGDGSEAPPAAAETATPPGEKAPSAVSRVADAAPWIAALIGGVGGIGALGYLRGRYQHSTLFLPERVPEGYWEPSAHGLGAEDVWFEAEGVRLHGWWMTHPGADASVLYCHGSSGSIVHRTGDFRRLAELRVNLLAFDYRGYGKSAGNPSERGLYADVRAAYDHLVGPLGAAPETTLLFGHSLGGAVAIDAALDRPAAGLVVESSFTDIRDMARSLYPQLPLHWVARNEFRSIAKVARLTLPKLFVHGAEDETVPLELGRRLYEAAAEPKDFYVVPGAGHNDVQTEGGAAYTRRLERFKRACLD